VAVYHDTLPRNLASAPFISVIKSRPMTNIKSLRACLLTYDMSSIFNSVKKAYLVVIKGID
jgi:hypothetical protein